MLFIPKLAALAVLSLAADTTAAPTPSSSTDVVARGGKHDDFKYYHDDDKDHKNKWDVSQAILPSCSAAGFELTGDLFSSVSPLQFDDVSALGSSHSPASHSS